MEDQSDKINRMKQKVNGRIWNLSRRLRNAAKYVTEQLEIKKTLDSI